MLHPAVIFCSNKLLVNNSETGIATIFQKYSSHVVGKHFFFHKNPLDFFRQFPTMKGEDAYGKENITRDEPIR